MDEARLLVVGLCGTCGWMRVVDSSRGQAFYLCRRSLDDPAYPRYPVIPVVVCPGYAPVDPDPRRSTTS
jgi:hypothetical protein